MITQEQFDTEVKMIIENAIREDVGDGDHSSLACIPANARGKAKLLVKDKGIIGGVNFAKKVFAYVDKDLKLDVLNVFKSPFSVSRVTSNLISKLLVVFDGFK